MLLAPIGGDGAVFPIALESHCRPTLSCPIIAGSRVDSRSVTGGHRGQGPGVDLSGGPFKLRGSLQALSRSTMGIDFHLIANFAALALITLAGPAVVFILFYRRGAL